MIPLRVIEAREEVETYRIFVLGALSLAILAGFVLGIHIPVGRLLDSGAEAHRPDMIATHGQVQLQGFAGMFVMGMAVRLMPRFAGRPLRFSWLIWPVWSSVLGALVVRAFVQLWLPDTMMHAYMVGTQLLLLAGFVGFSLMVCGTLQGPNRSEATGLFFILGSLFGVTQSVLATYLAFREFEDGSRVFTYLPNQALIQTQLFGFVLLFLAGVALRAIPTMVGQPRSDRAARLVAVTLSLSTALVAGALLWLEYVRYSIIVVRITDFALVATGVGLLSITWLTGILRPAANRVRPASRHQFYLVRTAFVWLLFGGFLATYLGTLGLIHDTLPTQLMTDALRHSLTVGVISNLIVGMALLILPEFAGERLIQTRQSRLAFAELAAINVAAVLRVAPALAGYHWSVDVRSASMAASGLLMEFAMIAFAASLIRLVRRNALGEADSG